MTDRELLEKAARAAGIGWDRDLECWYGEPFVRTDWDPITDDGDALRLAVKLYLWEAIRLAHRLVGKPGCPDIYAATRRAIVQAAAAIGEQMQGASE